MRGDKVKFENRGLLQIKRSFLTREYLLNLDKKLCNGCGVCVVICPKEAIKENEPLVVNGHLVKKPTIGFDINLCIFCGECAVLCPLNALTMEVDGKKISTITKNEAFPYLIKGIKVSEEKCEPKCEIKCQEECPTKAIKVLTERKENGEIKEITDVQIDESKCIYCKKCEVACPLDVIQVKKPFQGTIEIDTNLCPQGCVACEDICPTKAIHIEDNKPTVITKFCVFCSGCQKVCPENAIKVDRKWVFHTDIKAAAWLTALKKLTSVDTVSKELRIKSMERKLTRVKDMKG